VTGVTDAYMVVVFPAQMLIKGVIFFIHHSNQILQVYFSLFYAVTILQQPTLTTSLQHFAYIMLYVQQEMFPKTLESFEIAKWRNLLFT
jgi:hypothetical protein